MTALTETAEVLSAYVEPADGVLLVPPALTLSLVAGPCTGTLLQGKGFRLNVGRTKASKLHIRDTAVSEKHASLSWSGTHWVVRDLGSSNGTAVNGRQLNAIVDTVALQAGDEILFGHESRALVQLEHRTAGDLTVEQLLASVFETAVERVQAAAQDQARALLTEVSQAKSDLGARLLGSSAA